MSHCLLQAGQRAPFVRGGVCGVGQTPPGSLSLTLGAFFAGHTQGSVCELGTSMWLEVTTLLCLQTPVSSPSLGQDHPRGLPQQKENAPLVILF